MGKMKQTRRVQALRVYSQPREGPENREDSKGVHSPANLWQPVLVQPLAATHQSEPQHTGGQGGSRRDTWDEEEGDQKAKGLGSLTRAKDK